MLDRLIVADSVTRLGPEAQGRVVIGGSHGGTYAGYLAAKARVAGVILNDAGVGLDAAGIGCLPELAAIGVAAAAVSHRSARIGDGWDQLARGVISHANAVALSRGVEPGMPCREAARRLAAAPFVPGGDPAPASEGRFPVPGVPEAAALDSNSLVTDADAGRIAVTGSHGGILGLDPASAVRVPVFAALYSDADGGIEGAGHGRLPALDARGIAAATVSVWTARIGDGRSMLATGILSAVNAAAARRGARVAMTVMEFVHLMADALRKEPRP
jgi:hypothetical protein